MLSRRKSVLLGLTSVAAGLLFCYLLRALNFVSPDLLASPGDVVAAFLDIARNGYRDTTLTQNIAATLGRCLAGFALATVLGVPLGLWMGTSRYTAASVNFIIQFLRPLPPLSYLVLLILWFGAGDLSKIALLFMGSIPDHHNRGDGGGAAGQPAAHPGGAIAWGVEGPGVRLRAVPGIAVDDLHRHEHRAGRRILQRCRGGTDGSERWVGVDDLLRQSFPAQ